MNVITKQCAIYETCLIAQLTKRTTAIIYYLDQSAQQDFVSLRIWMDLFVFWNHQYELIKNWLPRFKFGSNMSSIKRYPSQFWDSSPFCQNQLLLTNRDSWSSPTLRDQPSSQWRESIGSQCGAQTGEAQPALWWSSAFIEMPCQPPASTPWQFRSFVPQLKSPGVQLDGGEPFTDQSIAYNPNAPTMYGIFTYIWAIFCVHVSKYTVHGVFG